MDECRLVYVTTSDEAEALRLGRQVVEQRLAACANVLPAMRSIYWWDDEVQSAQEAILLLKTREDLLPSLTAALVELHSYECPCVVALPICGGYGPFLDWIRAETQGTRTSPPQ